MNYILPIPKGIDYWVQNLQTRLYNRLKSKWGVTDQNYNCFGRAYRNNTDDGYIPEFFDPGQGKYVAGSGQSVAAGLFFEDTIAAMSFFGLVDPIKKAANRDDIVKVQLIYFVRLDRITPGGITQAQNQRLDEVCVNDVKNYIQSNGNNFIVTDTYKDIDKVLERYSGVLKKRALQDDMHPKFCFRIDLELRYNPLLNT